MPLFSSVSQIAEGLQSSSLEGADGPPETHSDASNVQKGEVQDFAPPPGPPPPPALIPVELPLVIPHHRFNLHDQGWTTITFDSSDDALYRAYKGLFEAAGVFFDREYEYKSKYLTKDGSEEGWTQIKGEKEFITLRHLGFCPDELAIPAGRVWEEASNVLNEMLGRIEESLEFPAGTLTAFSTPCSQLDHVKRATMMRIFRYENWAPKIVAEPHNDLGLLSLVIGDVPGLEVWNKYNQTWFPVERTYVDAWKNGDERPKASVLVGRQLQKFSNERYAAGGHLVRSYKEYLRMNESMSEIGPSQQPQHQESSSTNQSSTAPDAAFGPKKHYRFSIVFVLRAHWPIPVDTDLMTSRITGPHKQPIKNETAGQLFTRIRQAHFNINIDIKEREQQKKKIREAKKNNQQGSNIPTKASENIENKNAVGGTQDINVPTAK